MLTDGDISRIAGRIVRGCAPLVVGTFGSYATGLAHERSDLDVFVITPAPKRAAARRQIQQLLFSVLHPIDVHVFAPHEFEETACEKYHFTWVIARQARLYHWTEDAPRQVPSLFRPSSAQTG
jgi:predicted nucleotidyltransferase